MVALEECSRGFRGKHKNIYNLENIPVHTFISFIFIVMNAYSNLQNHSILYKVMDTNKPTEIARKTNIMNANVSHRFYAQVCATAKSVIA